MSRQGFTVKCLTVSAMLSALGVILLAAGSLLEFLDLTVAVLASFFSIYAVIEMGSIYPWMIWIVTSVLSLILLPQKSPALFYGLFAGVYPIVKEKLERLPRAAAWVLKYVFLHLALALIFFAAKLFLPDLLDYGETRLMLLAVYAVCLVAFWLYDFVLTRLITFYLVKLRKRLKLK